MSGEATVYLSKRQWRKRNSNIYLVWIAAEGLTPERLFGIETPPSLYVWIADRQYELARQLQERIEKTSAEVLGELDRKASGYIVTHAVQQYVSGESIQVYAQTLGKQIVTFFGHYAEILDVCDEIVEQYV